MSYKKIICEILSEYNSGNKTELINAENAELIQFAEQQGMLPLLAEKQDEFPDSVRKAIAIACAVNTQMLMQRCSISREVFDCFSLNKVDVLLFKGATNAYLIYNQPQHRQHGDIDIFTREDHIGIARQAFLDLGFSIDPVEPSRFGPYQTTATRKASNGTSIAFDIHWKINNRLLLSDVLDFDEVLDQAVDIEVYGEGVKGFGYSDALLVACIHEAGGLPEERGRLIGLYDMHLLMSRLGEPGVVASAERAIQKGIGEIFIYCLEQATNAFGDKNQEGMVDELKSRFDFYNNEPSAGLLRANRGWLEDQMLDLKAVNGAPATLSFLFDKLARKLGRGN